VTVLIYSCQEGICGISTEIEEVCSDYVNIFCIIFHKSPLRFFCVLT